MSAFGQMQEKNNNLSVEVFAGNLDDIDKTSAFVQQELPFEASGSIEHSSSGSQYKPTNCCRYYIGG